MVRPPGLFIGAGLVLQGLALATGLGNGTASVPVVRIGVLLAVFGPETSNYAAHSDWSSYPGVWHALLELNDKTDGVADDLLPDTQLLFAFRDSKCDGTFGLSGALELTRAFDGAGVSAIVGAACSGASVLAARVAAASNVPMISPTVRPSL